MYLHTSMRMPGQPRTSLRDEARAALDTCPGWNLRLAARRITQALDHALAPAGLGVAQLGLLAQIAVAADDTLGALAQRTGLEQSTLSRNLRTLQAAGLVEIALVESDLRRRAVWLTETGARRLEAALPLWRDAQQRLAAHLAPDLLRQVAQATAALAAS